MNISEFSLKFLEHIMTSSPLSVGVSIFRGTIGCGILAMPYCIRKAGLIPSLFLFVFVCAITTYTTVILVKSALFFQRCVSSPGASPTSSAKQTRNNDFGTFQDRCHADDPDGTEDALEMHAHHSHHHSEPDVHSRPPERRYDIDDEEDEDNVVTYSMLCTAAFGNPFGKHISWLALLPTQWIVCVTFLVFVVTNSADLTENHQLALVVTAVLECILVIPRSTSYLAFTSLFGNIAFAASIGCVLYYTLVEKTLSHAEGNITMVGRSTGIAEAFGILVFGFSAYAETLGVLSSANSKARRSMPRIVTGVLFSVLVLCLTFSIIVAAAFGKSTAENTLDNLPHNKRSMILFLVRTSMSFVMVCTFPLVIFPVFHVVETTLLDPQHTATRLASRWLIVWSTAFVAYLFGNRFGPATAIGGGFGAILGYVLPPMFDLIIYPRETGVPHTLRRKLGNYFVILFGVFAFVFSIAGAVREWLTADD
eukprot:PhM_4_TR11342/c0_g1_i1/m.55669/K14209/SLC36A, PAT; solute carrier family 36 (proton-coupled amino acid transporter)